MRSNKIKTYLKNLKRYLFMERSILHESQILDFEKEIRVWEIVLVFRGRNKKIMSAL